MRTFLLAGASLLASPAFAQTGAPEAAPQGKDIIVTAAVPQSERDVLQGTTVCRASS